MPRVVEGLSEIVISLTVLDTVDSLAFPNTVQTTPPAKRSAHFHKFELSNTPPHPKGHVTLPFKMSAFVTGLPSFLQPTPTRTNYPRRRARPNYAPMTQPQPAKMAVAMPASAREEEEEVRAGTLASGCVHMVEAPEQFDALLAAAGPDGLVVADFMAKWCRKCVYLKARLPKLAAENPQTYFCTIDVNHVARLPRQFSIANMPTFVFIRDGQTLESYVGAEDAQTVAAKLRERVAHYNSASTVTAEEVSS